MIDTKELDAQKGDDLSDKLKELVDFADGAFLLPNKIRLAIIEMCMDYKRTKEQLTTTHQYKE